jgi:DNA polymerase I
MAAVAAMEHNGVPIDTEALALLRNHWEDIQQALIDRIDGDYHVFEGTTFKHDKFAVWLEETGTPWPRLESGRLELSDDAFHRAASIYPAMAPLRELRNALSELRLNDLAVSAEMGGTAHCCHRSARTSRNQPSNSKFIFGPSVWLRGLIKPPLAHGVAYIDYEQQEFAIAAALSGDRSMQAAYSSSDPYLEFAKQAGAVPPDATKHTVKFGSYSKRAPWGSSMECKSMV